MKKIQRILLILILLPLSVCGQEATNQTDSQNRKQGKWVKLFPNGKPAYEAVFVNDKPIGELKRYYDNGKLRAIQQFAEGSDTCYVQLFTSKEEKQAVGCYVNEKKEGKWSYFDEEENTILVEHYSKGKRNGQSVRYYPSGERLETVNWIADLQDGVLSRYYENGNTNFEMLYVKGVLSGKARYCYPSGAVRLEGEYLNGLRQGRWARYSEDGKLQKIATYNKGISDTEDEDFKQESDELKLLQSKKGTIPEPDESTIINRR